MTITEPVYANRESIKRALEINETARANSQIDRLLGSCSRSMDGELHRIFYPRIATLRWDWINVGSPTPWRLWLDDKELFSLTSLTSGGTSIPTNRIILYPNDGPPYNRVEIDTSTSSSFTLGSTHQNAIVISGVYAGCALIFASIGGLVAGINSSVTNVLIPDGSLVGIGDLLKIEDEYLLVTNRGWVDSTQNLQSDMTASNSAVTVAVTDGTAFFVDEVILLNSERMLIVDVAGNNLTVKRAWDGSVLATHSGSDIYVTRSLSVTRGAVGSTAAAHLISTAINRWAVPPLLNQRCIGEVLSGIEQEQSAYARVVGSGDNAFEARGIGLVDLRLQTCTVHGRQVRHRAV
jgi:hypothetical protein